MKKIFKKGFTLVELLVVIWIIWLLWFFSINSFLDFLKIREFKLKIDNLENIIKEEDLKINQKENFDYKIILEKNKDYFLIFKNNFSVWEKIILENFSENNINFKINEKIFEKNIENDEIIFENYKKESKKNIENLTNITQSEKDKEIKKIDDLEFFYINIYKNWKFIKEEKRNLNNLNFDLEKNNNYDFIFKIYNWEVLNNISIKKYDLEENIFLKEISNSENKTNIFSNIKIENIAWRKKIFLDWNQSKKIYLFFEDNNGKEFYFLIKN